MGNMGPYCSLNEFIMDRKVEIMKNLSLNLTYPLNIYNNNQYIIKYDMTNVRNTSSTNIVLICQIRQLQSYLPLCRIDRCN